MAPEQLLGDALDFRADIFAFGIVLHELITGKHPFMRQQLAATMFALVNGDFFQEGRVADPEVEAIVRKCMQLEPEERPQSAAEVVEELERLLRSRTQVSSRNSQVAYIETDHGNVAFQCVGVSGGAEVLVVPGLLSRFDAWAHEPEGAAFLRSLSEAGRLILFDHAGLGGSDRVPGKSLPAVDEEVDHIDALLDAVGASRVVLFALDTGAPLAALYAAVRPERVLGLAIYAGAPSYTSAEARASLSARAEGWGTEQNLSLCAPSIKDDARVTKWIASWERVTASPKMARVWLAMLEYTDTTAVLPFIACPTLVLQRQDDAFCSPAQSLPFANEVAGADRIVLPGGDHLAAVGGQDIVPHVTRFIRACNAAHPSSDDERTLGTWLLTNASLDEIPTRLRPRLALERDSMHLFRIDRPGAAKRLLGSSLPTDAKAVISCSKSAPDPEAMFIEMEPLFAQADRGAVVATPIAKKIIEGTIRPPQEVLPNVVSGSSHQGTERISLPERLSAETAGATTNPAAWAGEPALKATEKMRGRAGLLAAAAIAGFVVVGYWAFGHKKQEPIQTTVEPTQTISPRKSAHTLALESDPMGATVKEGDRDLGKTPIAITLDGEAKKPRTFTLSLDGYLDYAFLQEPATADVHFVARLRKAEAAPAASVAAAPEASASSSAGKRVTSTKTRIAPTTPAPAVTETPPPANTLDIKLER
jgi:pimeloyl-ACP methyl ester carboxylesterase